MSEESITKARPVPTANNGGTPNTSKPPVMRNPPPTPKKPLSAPPIMPRRTSSAGCMTTSALGKNIFSV